MGKLSGGKGNIKTKPENVLPAKKNSGGVVGGKTIVVEDCAPMTRPSRVTKLTTAVPKGSYCRVHVNPRRYREAVLGVDWNERFVQQ